jgi:diguanylate cyclase (GGDEF)-like protein
VAKESCLDQGMRPLQSQIKRHGLLGLCLCLSAWTGLVAAPSPTMVALAALSVTLFWSQLNFARAHAEAAKAHSSTQAALCAFPDAVMVASANGDLGFRKDLIAPREPVLPMLATDDQLAHPELISMGAAVLEAKAARQSVVRLEDGRILECRGTPFLDRDVLFIARDITETHADGERIRYLATHDSLTGLLNRNSFHVSLEQAIARTNRTQKPFGLLFVDLDHFKEVNDTMGHEAGDDLLKVVAARVRAVLRKSDTAYRLAGDEFTVIVENLETETDILKVANKLCTTLAEPYFDSSTAPAVSASIGAVTYPGMGATPDELLRMADRAMYQSKALGRNQVVLLTPESV